VNGVTLYETANIDLFKSGGKKNLHLIQNPDLIKHTSVLET
jgi:hypothetical protein